MTVGWRFAGVLIIAGLCVRTSSANDVYNRGHGDFLIDYAKGSFQLSVHLAGGAYLNGQLLTADRYLNPLTTVISVPPSTRKIRTTQGSFVGVEVGQHFWRLPQGGINAALEQAPFLGVSTENIGVGSFLGNRIDISLVKVVVAPFQGEFSLYHEPATRYMDTFDDSFANDSIAFFLQGHEHFSWSFSKSGLYQLGFKVSGTHAMDGYRETTTVLSFLVQAPRHETRTQEVFVPMGPFGGAGFNFDGMPAPEPASILAIAALVFGAACVGIRMARRRRSSR